MGQRNFTHSEFADAVAKCTSISEVLRHVGLTPAGSTYVTFHRLVDELNLDTSHFLGKRSSLGSEPANKGKTRQTLEEILVVDSYYDRGRLKTRLIKAGLKKNECEECEIKDWNGKPITFQLEHVNGINSDNRLSNLRLLCPNCHSQTATFAGRNKGWRTRAK